MTVHYLMENGELVTRGSNIKLYNEIGNTLESVKEVEIVESSIGCKIMSVMYFSKIHNSWVTVNRHEFMR